jgi:3'(2'), 5'-bisphosphate nucleotidase
MTAQSIQTPSSREGWAALLVEVVALCRKAGAEILRHYGADCPVIAKADHSPLTAADQASHNFIVKTLGNLTSHIPIISEEGSFEPSHDGSIPAEFWLVDPLDGTKEFLKRTGDFTVNVALLQSARPVLGVVYTPTSGLTYFAGPDGNAWRQQSDSAATQIRTSRASSESLRIVASKDHAGPEVEALLRRLPGARLSSIGSSLKFCLVADGTADFYPRFVPTMEWDTAAAQCIVEAAGGRLLTLDGEPLTYGKLGWRNPSIVTVGDLTLPWRDWIASPPEESQPSQTDFPAEHK